jgi:RimJ/RimL family protein N-acetyltransferase
MNVILETERLRLREFTLDDTAFIIELLNTPGWLEFIGKRNVRTEGQAVSYLLNGPLTSYRVNDYGLWMVENKETKEPMGMCGIINRENLDTPDIGFAFLPQFEGKGYAYEIASATLKYALQVVGIPHISAITLPKNSKSIKLLEKLGLKYIKSFSFPDNKEELLLYRI